MGSSGNGNVVFICGDADELSPGEFFTQGLSVVKKKGQWD